MLLFLFVFTVSSVPMHNVHKMLRNRTMSMEDYDKQMKERKNSLTVSCGGGGSDSDPASPSSMSPTSPFGLSGGGLKPSLAPGLAAVGE